METENPNGSRKGIELEKLKRRLIRSVARKLKEKKPEDEMWKDMKNEIGNNGKRLWERMRLLTLKKLKRLVEADDIVHNITPVARMTLTDWLLFDLVIVHEKIDVINREKLNGNYDSRLLNNLFSLVQRFQIEGRSGEDLAEAWTAATVYYNSKGHQCSPMMLQRRWYQIKELTRHKFYKFWYAYRGNQRALITAKQDSPDDLQKAIALKYPHVITECFPTWEERIESRLVILPDELSVKMRQRSLMKASDTSVPDVVLVEPHIETIDLGAISDEDEEPFRTEEITESLPTVRIKSEPPDTGIDIDDNMQHYENPPTKKCVFEEEIERLQMVEENFDNSLENNDKKKSIVIEPTSEDGESDDEEVVDQNDITPAVNNDEIVTDQDEACDAIEIDDGENNNETSLQIDSSKGEAEVHISNAREKEKGVIEKKGDTVERTDDVIMAADELNMAVLEITSVSRAGINLVDVNDLVERVENVNAPIEQHINNNTCEPVISTILTDKVMVENDLPASELTLKNDVFVQKNTAEGVEVLPVISTVSSKGVKVEIESEDDVICKQHDQSLEESSQADVADLEFRNISVSTKIAEISSVASAGVKIENVDDVLEEAEKLDEEIVQLNDDNNGQLFPAILTIPGEGFDLENDPAVSECALADVDTAISNEVIDFLPVISNISSNGVKVEIETGYPDDKLRGEYPVEESTQEYDAMRKTDDKSTEPSPVAVEDLNFDDMPVQLSFTDENINFADDGIAYVDEDEVDIIKITDHILPPIKNEAAEEEETKKDIKNESQEQLSMDEEAEERAQKFDLKLLMYPVVYTTKLDDMTGIEESAQYEHIEGIEKIDKIYTLSKPMSNKSSTDSKPEVDSKPKVETSQDKIGIEEDINVSNLSDDDLFKDESRESLGSDIESDSDYIDDSKRVKMSSYLLRKPKHRRYNPVILCKNPDFNTRLKKLSVGFFMSTRNRLLLQSCIPMTIDLTKAFENKLINGTLYLKDVPKVPTLKTEPVIEINDDIQITSADLIQPTAVQQSMMSIDETLPSELQKRMVERMRGINLPDISLVRRLNQHIMTAEVTPLRLDNQASKNPQPDPTNFDQNIKDDHKNENETPNNLSVNLLRSVSPRPQPLFNETPVIAKQTTPPPPMVSIADTPLYPSDPVCVAPPVSNVSSGNFNTLTNANIAPDGAPAKRKMRKTYYPTPTWNKPRISINQPNKDQFHTDALLTLDTLYKMLSALDPKDINLQDMLPKKKVKKKEKRRDGTQVSDQNAGNNTNTDAVIDITDGDDEIIVPAKKANYKPRPRRKIRVLKKSYCCFNSFKNAMDLGNLDNTFLLKWPKRRHRCVKAGMCTCCCKLLYPERVDEEDRSINQTKHNADDNDVNDKQVQTEQLDSEDIENLSLGIKQSEQEDQPKSPLNAYRERFANTINNKEEGLLVAENSSDNVKTSNAEKGIEILSSNDEEAELKQSSPVNTTPIPKVRIYPGKTASTNLVHTSLNQDLPSTSQNISHDDMAGLITNLENTVIPMTETNVAKHELSQSKIHWNVSDKSDKTSPKTTDNNECHTIVKPIRRVGRPRKVPCLCRPNISNVKQGKIEINNGNDCVVHKTKKHVVYDKERENTMELNKPKESNVFLNKKVITDDNRPFFVGKGKILLTNIKMPSRKPPPPPAPEFINVKLPQGVQIVLMPDQTLTYVVAADVILTPEEYALIPQFLFAIQQQMANTTAVTLPVEDKMSNEIIDLDKNEVPKQSEVQDRLNEIIDIDNINTPPPPEISMVTADENTECNEKTVTQARKTINVQDSKELKIGTESNKLTVEKEIDSVAEEEEKDKDDKEFEMKIDILESKIKNKQKIDLTSVEEKNSNAVRGVNKPESFGFNSLPDKTSETNETNESMPSYNKDSASANQDTESRNENTNKKSLLSDLMEMSGIMEEDLTPLPVEVDPSQQPIILDTSNLVLQKPVPVSEVPDSPPKDFFRAQSSSGAVELMAVTSFAQLKYATDNKGKFFKLDLENGQLTSINVCIQRFNQREAASQSDSVIDLTDDPDVSITKAAEPKVPMYITERQIQRAKRPAILNHTQPHKRQRELMATVIEKKRRLVNHLSNNLKPANIPQSKMQVSSILKRNSNLLHPPPLSYYSKWKNMKKVSAKINLVDSDTPMEEEYLSSECSSDDEPLIHKAKRMRLGEAQASAEIVEQDAETLNEPEPPQTSAPSALNETIEEIEMLEDLEELQNAQQTSQENLAQNNQSELSNEDSQLDLGDDREEALETNEEDYTEEHLEDMEDDASQHSATSLAPVPTNLLLSGGALNAHNIPLHYSPNDADAQDDDCILGV